MASGVYPQMIQKALTGGLNIGSGGTTVKCALMTNAHVFNKAHTTWTDVSANEISGTGYTSGGVTLTGQSVTMDSGAGTVTFDANDVAWSGATFSAYHAVLYDSTNNILLGSIDFGGEQTITDGTFTISWNASGIIVITT